jgi:hypothetical protein
MKRIMDISLSVIFGIVLAGTFFVVYFLYSIQHAAKSLECVDRVLKTVESPDQKFVAFQYAEECSALSGDSININIQPYGTSHNSKTYRAVTSVKDGQFLKIKWERPNLLVIVGSSKGYVLGRSDKYNNIKIKYEDPY